MRALPLLLLCALLLPTAARAQTVVEPADLPNYGAVPIVGAYPFRAGDSPDWASPATDDSEWITLAPGTSWRRAFGRPIPRGWYRVHLRARSYPGEDAALLVPPLPGAWELHINGRPAYRAASPGQTAPDVSTVVPLSGLRRGDNLLALRAEAFHRQGGLRDELHVGSRDALVALQARRSAPGTAAVAVFLLIALYHAASWVADRRRRATLFIGLAALAACGWSLGSLDSLMGLFEAAVPRLRLRASCFFAAHAFGLLVAAELLRAPRDRTLRFGVRLSALAAVASLVVPPELVQAALAWSFLLTLPILLWVLAAAEQLPSHSAVVKGGVRATVAALVLAVLLDAWRGVAELGQGGMFGTVVLLLMASILVTTALQTSGARRRALRILEADRDGRVVVDGRGRIELANPAMGRMLGREPEELVGRAMVPYAAAGSRLALAETLRRVTGEGPRSEGELLDLRLEGARPVEAEVGVTVLEDETLLLSCRDVSERRRLEREVARAQRLDSLGMLAGGIAHDFNNLLAGILVSASELAGQQAHSGGDSARLEEIADAARRGGALTERLLQFARGRETRAVGVFLPDAVPDMLDLLGRTLGRHVEWRIHLGPISAPASIDESELEQILLNLCVNARDAMGARGGVVEVRAEEAGPPHEGMVLLLVRDEGVGMAPELLDRVMEPFVTTKGAGAGTGLGLSVVHGIVRRRGGSVDILSRVGEGTEVRVYLPLLEGPPTDRVITLPDSQGEGPLRVLLVDDEDTLRGFLRDALTRRGFEVTDLDGGRAVLSWLQERSEGASPVDVAVMDMMMPGVDGLEATRALRERWPGLPVVISSGFTGHDDISELEETGPTDMLRKPYRAEQLVEALYRVTAERADAAAASISGEGPRLSRVEVEAVED